ncbi:MAG TPA: DUF1634 domain-containing protein [Candidatus Acidoferrales bacterium]|nr:DUF1634 domain-containing protein [Candidatus Acidoferrales bacterium]
MPPSSSWADEKTERFLGVLLQAGVLLSGAVVLIGGILYLVHYGHNPASYHTFTGARAGLNSLSAVLSGVARLDSRAVIQLGLLLLIATPVVRVLLSVFAFWLERDRPYVIFTLVVLAVLLYSLLLGR